MHFYRIYLDSTDAPARAYIKSNKTQKQVIEIWDWNGWMVESKA